MAVIKTGFKSDRSESLEYRLSNTVDRVEIVRRDRLINRLNITCIKMFYMYSLFSLYNHFSTH